MRCWKGEWLILRLLIQCQEGKPACNGCVKMRLTCVYPTPPQVPSQNSQNPEHRQGQDQLQVVRGSENGSERGENADLEREAGYLRLNASFQATPTVFSMLDMKLFHHFMVEAHPHVPLGNDDVWVRDIAGYSHSVCAPFLK